MPDEPRIVPLTWSERRKGISGDLEDTVRHAQKRTWEHTDFVNKD